MSRNVKKSHAVPIVLIITLVVAAFAVGCFMIEPYNEQTRTQWKASAENADNDAVALAAEYEQKEKDSIAAWEAEKRAILNPPKDPDAKKEAEMSHLERIEDYILKQEADAFPAWASKKDRPLNPGPDTSGAALLPDISTENWVIVDLSGLPMEDNMPRAEMTRAELMNNGMLLVNEWHSRPLDFDESNIVSYRKYTAVKQKIQVDTHDISMFPVAWDALLEAVSAAKEEGLEYYIVSEAYRSWEKQNELFQSRKEKIAAKHTNYTDEQLNEEAKKEVNLPGTSEYNTGLSFKLKLYKKGDSEITGADYATSQQGVWMTENCWKYGLVFRFPLDGWPLPDSQDKKDITGVSIKMNLYRYVGKGNAAFMHYLDMCLEEYLGYLHRHPRLALYEDGALKYEVYCQYYTDERAVYAVPEGHSSLDNMGCVITVIDY